MRITRLYLIKRGNPISRNRYSPEGRGDIGKLSEIIPVAGMMLRENSGDYDYDWHPAPEKQYIVMLSGMLKVGLAMERRGVSLPGKFFLSRIFRVKGTSRGSLTGNRGDLCS